MSAQRLKIVVWLLLAILSVHDCSAQLESFLVVPNSATDKDGNSSTILPFTAYANTNFEVITVRYQQIFASSEFTNVPIGGSFITAFSFRADCTNRDTVGGFATNLVITLSTTQRKPDQLSRIFSENRGIDSISVLGPTNFGVSGNTVGCRLTGHTFSASDRVNLPTPFFYDPSKGNLLLEITHAGFGTIKTPRGRIDLDSVNSVGDGTSRAVALSSDAESADIVDSEGLVTFFVQPPISRLTISLETNQVVLTWPTDPTVLRLQWSAKLGTGDDWQDYAGEITTNRIRRTARLSPETLFSKRYYRLFWNTPQVGVPGIASEVMQNPLHGKSH